MAPNQPLVSVLMNCFNGERYIREAIDSVIAQTYPYWELIFWDNQSTDNSAAICRSYRDPRIRYFVSAQHTNLGAARALALEQARGEFIAILDVDDVWFPHKLEKQIPCFDDRQVGIGISDTLFFTDGGKQRQLFKYGLPPQGQVFADLLASYFCSLETVVMRHSAIKSLSHGFDGTFSHICDFDLVVRLSKDWKLVCVAEVLAKWRIHMSSGTWAEPDRFYREKIEFIRKMDALPEFQEVWQKSRASFVRNTMVSEAINRLVLGERTACRMALGHHAFSGPKAALVYLLSWSPFATDILRSYRRAKAMV